MTQVAKKDIDDNLSLATRVLLEQVTTNKESLVNVFQELFGPHEPSAKDKPAFLGGGVATDSDVQQMIGVPKSQSQVGV